MENQNSLDNRYITSLSRSSTSHDERKCSKESGKCKTVGRKTEGSQLMKGEKETIEEMIEEREREKVNEVV